MTAGAPFVVGVAGWKNSGKTTLLTRMVAELVRRGYRVATVKHSHHPVSAEQDGTDSARHRDAGAYAVAVISPAGWAIADGNRLLSLDPDPEPPLATVVARLGPADIVIVEGLKRAAIPKIETRRKEQGKGAPLAPHDATVFAIAADHNVGNAGVPAYALDDIAGLTDALLRHAGLPPRKEPAR